MRSITLNYYNNTRSATTLFSSKSIFKHILLLIACYSSSLFAQTPCLVSEQATKATVVQSAYQAEEVLTPALLSHSLKALIRANQKCAQKYGLCQLDFDPLYDSQDSEIKRVERLCQNNQVIATLSRLTTNPNPLPFPRFAKTTHGKLTIYTTQLIRI